MFDMKTTAALAALFPGAVTVFAEPKTVWVSETGDDGNDGLTRPTVGSFESPHVGGMVILR